MALKRLLGGEGRRAHQVDDVALLQLQVAARIYNDVRQTVALLANIVIIDAGQIQRLHATPHEIRDFGPLDLLRVIIPSLVHVIERVLEGGEEGRRKRYYFGFVLLRHMHRHETVKIRISREQGQDDVCG